MVKTCRGCKFGQQSIHTGSGDHSFSLYMKQYKILVAKKEFINNLEARYSIYLKSIHRYFRVLLYASIVFIYMCHQSTKFLRKNLKHDLHSDKQRLLSTTKHIGCKFEIKVICPN